MERFRVTPANSTAQYVRQQQSPVHDYDQALNGTQLEHLVAKSTNASASNKFVGVAEAKPGLSPRPSSCADYTHPIPTLRPRIGVSTAEIAAPPTSSNERLKGLGKPWTGRSSIHRPPEMARAKF
ncbi:hypothetical protein KM043_010306 [Ampulex compressa]|nr:hypothetical protein KM043_010306 [Ampulex compressa]